MVCELSHSYDFDDTKKKGLETNLFMQEEFIFDEKICTVDDFDQKKNNICLQYYQRFRNQSIKGILSIPVVPSEI